MLFLIIKVQRDLLEKVFDKSFHGEEEESVLKIYYLSHNSLHSACSGFCVFAFQCNALSYRSPRTLCGARNISLSRQPPQDGNP